MATDPTQQHGGQHPIAAATGQNAWEFATGVFAWRVGNDVVLQGDDGDVTIPAAQIALLGRALLAVHVVNAQSHRDPQ
jgi:hypothetical protein